jgi:hypothetical protein
VRPAKLAPVRMMSTVPSVQALVDVGFLAQRGGREHLDVVLAVGALLDLVAAHTEYLWKGSEVS